MVIKLLDKSFLTKYLVHPLKQNKKVLLGIKNTQMIKKMVTDVNVICHLDSVLSFALII